MNKVAFSILSAVAALAGSATAADGDIRLMSYNILHGKGADRKVDISRTAEAIMREKPDFVGLQEVDCRVSRSRRIDEPAELARLTGLHPTFASAFPYQGGEYGRAILSREKPLAVERIQLDGKHPGVLLLCEFRDFWFGTMHLDLIETNRLRQVGIVRDAVAAKSQTKPVFLTGDWNATPKSKTLDAMRKFMTVLSREDDRTFHGYRGANALKGYCIDYIAVDAAHAGMVAVKESHVTQNEVASDHNPLVATVALAAKPVPVTYIMVCCHGADKGTQFLANGKWDSRHDYRDYGFARDMMRKIKESGINVVGIDFTNPSQWDQFRAHHWPMLENVAKAAAELDMQYFIFMGNTHAHTMKYWNEKAKIVWETFAQDRHYRRYGFGDDRPMLTIFLPGKDFKSHFERTPENEKNWLAKFRIGTCQVNDPIVPTPTDGWGYRNMSAGSTDLARFVAPNSGVGPGTWARVDAEEWRRRVKWALGAKEYAVIGTYDDTCDCIFWGIADVRKSQNKVHVHESTKDDPYIYYNIVREELEAWCRK